MSEKDPYVVLWIERSATDEEVKKAYRTLARKYHPDKYTDSDLASLAEEKMKEVNAAYEQIRKEREAAARGETPGGESGGTGAGGYGRYTGFEGFGAQAPDSEYAKVRVLINDGRVEEADAILNAVPERERSAEWFFLKGCILLRLGRGFDAQNCFDRACAMDPYNTEYQTARSRLRNRTAGFGTGYHTTRGEEPCSACDMCGTLLCMNCCCNCCGH